MQASGGRCTVRFEIEISHHANSELGPFVVDVRRIGPVVRCVASYGRASAEEARAFVQRIAPQFGGAKVNDLTLTKGEKP